MIWCYWHKTHEIMLLPPSSGCHGNHSSLARKLPDSWIGKNKKTQPTSCIKWITSTCKERKENCYPLINYFYFFILIRNTEQIGDLTFPHTGFQCFHEVGRWHLGTGYEKKKNTLKYTLAYIIVSSQTCAVLGGSWVKPLSCLWIQSQNRKRGGQEQKYPSSLRNRNDTLKKYLLILHKPNSEHLGRKAHSFFHL